MITPWKKSHEQPRQHIKKQRHYFANKVPSSQGYGFSSSHVWMWELDCEESWGLKNWCFWTMVWEKTLNFMGSQRFGHDWVSKQKSRHRRHGLIPGLGRSPGGGKLQPTPIFLPGESHGRRSLVGYSPRGHKESDTTERLYFHFQWTPRTDLL